MASKGAVEKEVEVAERGIVAGQHDRERAAAAETTETRVSKATASDGRQGPSLQRTSPNTKPEGMSCKSSSKSRLPPSPARCCPPPEFIASVAQCESALSDLCCTPVQYSLKSIRTLVGRVQGEQLGRCGGGKGYFERGRLNAVGQRGSEICRWQRSRSMMQSDHCRSAAHEATTSRR